MQYKAFALAAFASLATAQDLATTLANQTSLSNLTTYLGLFPDFTATLSQLQNITLLAPNNAAFATLLNSSAGAAVSNNNTALIQALFSYHVLNGSYSNFSAMPEFIPTILMPPTFTNVTGGQVVEAMGGSNTSFYSGLLQNSSTVSQSVNFTGGVIHIIDTFLTIPQNISATAAQLNLTSVVGALTNTSLAATVDGLSDVTAFIPNNAAFQSIGSALGNLSMEDLTSILTYHVVSGSMPYYSTSLSNTSLATVQGSNLTISVVGSDVFVNSARVLIPDIIVANGVVHVIDNVLNPMNSTATANPAMSTGAPAFNGASSASDVPFTSGVATPTSSVATESAAGATSSSAAGAMPMKTGAVGAAALFGGMAAVMNM